MPLFEHAVLRALAGDRQAVELARETDGEIADIDHLLDFPQTLGADLSRLEGDQHPQVVLYLPKRISQLPDDFAALRRRHHPPAKECLLSVFDNHFIVGPGGGSDARQWLTVGRIDRLDLGACGASDPLAEACTGIDLLETETAEQGDRHDEAGVRGFRRSTGVAPDATAHRRAPSKSARFGQSEFPEL